MRWDAADPGAAIANRGIGMVNGELLITQRESKMLHHNKNAAQA